MLIGRRSRTLIGLLLAWMAVSASTFGATDLKPHSDLIEIRDRIDLHYLDWGGDKQPMLLLAGLGDTSYVFAQFAPLLASDYRVLALTRRGYGQSDVTSDGYTIPDRVEDVRSFLDALKISKVILVGHSAAGDELTGFALKYPDRVKALVYLDAAYDRADPTTPQPHMDAWKKVAAQLYGGISDDASYRSRRVRRTALSNLFRTEYGVNWGDALEENFSETTVSNVDGTVSPRTPSFVGRAIRQGAGAERLDVAAVHVPAFLIFARGPLPEQITLSPDLWQAVRSDEREYGVYFQEYLRRLQRQNPSLQVKVLADARHYFFLRDPVRVAEWVKDFISRQ